MKKSKVLEQNDTQLLAGAFGIDNEEFNEEMKYKIMLITYCKQSISFLTLSNLN